MTGITTAETACEQGEHGYITDRARYLARLRRIEGQARVIRRMVDEEQYCIDILTQVAALTGALQNVAEEKIREASQAIGRLVR